MAMLMLALPGSVFIYNGEELGLPDVLDLPDEVLQDPTWERSGHTERGRDKCRVPIPWSGDAPPFGFSTTADTWLPMPAEWAALTVEKQGADPDSTLSFFQRALELRRKRAEFDGGDIDWQTAPRDAQNLHVQNGHFVFTVSAEKQRAAIEQIWSAGGTLISVVPKTRTMEELFVELMTNESENQKAQ